MTEWKTCTVADIPLLWEQERLHIEQYEDFTRLDREKILNWCRRKIENRISEYLRIESDGETAGFLRLSEEEGKTELDSFYILPAFRRRGIGSEALRRVCEETETPIFLYVFAENDGAIRFYERFGFRFRERVPTDGAPRSILERPAKGRE